MPDELPQMIFDRVWTGLKGQGFVRSIEGDDCMYRGPDGLKCAVGHCIDDEHYNMNMETEPAENALVGDAVCATLGIERKDYPAQAMMGLQHIHDECAEPSNMEQCLRDFANHEGLQVPE